MDDRPSAMRASITLCAEHAELTRLQAYAGEFAHECGLPDDERLRLLVILEELFTNTVTHGQGPQSAGGSITVALGWRTGHLRISFVDDGPPFDPLAFRAPDLDAPGKERPIGGLGIHIVRSLVDQARYRREGGRNHLHLVRHIAPARNAVAHDLRQR
jgi:anti-sigma regulatory factor (Ser/Thr protein kinase)